VAFLPADHVIPDSETFRAALHSAVAAAQAGHLVTLGITPTFPHTGYGYIKRGDALARSTGPTQPMYKVERFLEKPNLATAESFLADGSYYWNGGIFISRADQMLAEIQRQLPEVYSRLEKILASLDGDDAASTLAEVWSTMPDISIDYGVM